MPAWFPLIKASLPYVAQIVTTALPAFTAKPDVSKTDPLIAQQIEELQTAVTHNAESIHVLAEKLQQTIQGIDGAAVTLQQELVKMRRYCRVAFSLAVIAMILAMWALAR